MFPLKYFTDEFVFENITNNQTLKNVSFGIEREASYFNLACN